MLLDGIKFTDTIQGNVALDGGHKKYWKTKDSSSPSGHSLIAQIEMTHAGIVTKNYGFYLPTRMRDGSGSFTANFNKPILIGHDETDESKPVGRVIDASYIDTSAQFTGNDKHLSNLLRFQDKKIDEKTLDMVNYIITNYDSLNDYMGMGHIRGSLSITDGDTIEAILDERYLTVSTSMSSDSANCNICASDWVADGMCEHYTLTLLESLS